MRGSRRGMTLVELIVVITIFMLMIGLAISFIPRSRSNTLHIRCLSYQRQISAGLIDFEGRHNRLPHYGTFARTAGDEDNSEVSKLDFANPRHSWVVEILPFLERSDISDYWSDGSTISETPGKTDVTDEGYPNHRRSNDLSLDILQNYTLSHRHLSVLTCRYDEKTAGSDEALSYVVNCGFLESGTEHNWSRTKLDWDGDGEITDADRDYKFKTGVFWAGSLDGESVEDRKSNLVRVHKGDGLSTTVMLVENRNAGFARNLGRARDQIDYDDFTWAYPDVNSVGFGIRTEEICGDGPLTCRSPYTHPLTQSQINGDSGTKPGQSPYPSSAHPGLVIVSFCDGSTRALGDDIDPRIWFALVTPQGAKLPTNPEAGIFLTEQPIGENDF